MKYTVQIQMNDYVSVTLSRDSVGSYFLNLRIEEEPVHHALPVVEGESLLLGSLRDILQNQCSLSGALAACVKQHARRAGPEPFGSPGLVTSIGESDFESAYLEVLKDALKDIEGDR